MQVNDIIPAHISFSTAFIKKIYKNKKNMLENYKFSYNSP